MKIALDVDGVLLNWYHTALTKLDQRPIPGDWFPTSWDMDIIWGNWREMENDIKYWENLPPLCNPKLLEFTPFVYLTSAPEKFRTAREKNLYNLGFPYADVVYSQDKLSYCLANEVDKLIDDKPATVQKFIEQGYSNKIIQYIPFYGMWEPVPDASLIAHEPLTATYFQ